MNYWNEKVQIGNRSYPRFMGAPLDGYTDSPFRRLVREFSCHNLLYTEMRHVVSIAYDKGSSKSLCFESIERPLNFQITANSTDFIETALGKIVAAGVDGIDLNIACPARNVIKSRAGSALMADMALLKEVLTILRKKGSLPLTVKMRAGFKEKNALEVVKLVEDCGVDAIAIHPRLQTEKFHGQPDYKLVGDIKRAVSIPVLYSGGIHTFIDAKNVYEQTGVDGFLIGRGMFGEPWKLTELEAHSLGNNFEVDQTMVIETALKHLDYLFEYYREGGLYNFRKHIPFYICDFQGASALRQSLIISESVNEIKKGLRNVVGM